MYNLPCSAEPVQDLAVLAEQPDQLWRLEQGSTTMRRCQSRKVLQFRKDTKNQKREKMVGSQQADRHLLEKVAEVYNWIGLQIRSHGDLAGHCDACGRCCNFGSVVPADSQQFDHHLFVTGPELMYLAANLGPEVRKPMPTGQCPYNTAGRCRIYQYRFAGCRIFCCSADTDFQSGLSESAMDKFKSICTEFHIPYHYTDLSTALNSFADV